MNNMATGFSTALLSEAFRKYHAGDSLTDDDIVEMMRFLGPMELDGWVLDSRFTFFIVEIREICSRLRSFMNARVSNGNWRPTRDINSPRFLTKKDEGNGQS